MQLSNFGEQFASKVLEKTYQSSVVDGIANRDYEGEIKKPGERQLEVRRGYKDYRSAMDQAIALAYGKCEVRIVESPE